jgi:hypothetical protein
MIGAPFHALAAGIMAASMQEAACAALSRQCRLFSSRYRHGCGAKLGRAPVPRCSSPLGTLWPLPDLQAYAPLSPRKSLAGELSSVLVRSLASPGADGGCGSNGMPVGAASDDLAVRACVMLPNLLVEGTRSGLKNAMLPTLLRPRQEDGTVQKAFQSSSIQAGAAAPSSGAAIG